MKKTITFFKTSIGSTSFLHASKPKQGISVRLFVFLATFLVLTAQFAFGQITEGFETGMPVSFTGVAATSVTASDQGTATALGSGSWKLGDVNRESTYKHGGLYSAQIHSVTGACLSTPVITNGVGTVTFWVAASSISSAGVQLQISTDGGTTYTQVGSTYSTYAAKHTFYQQSATINQIGSNIRLRWYRTAATIYIDDISITSYATPSITAPFPASLSGFTTIAGTASVSQTFTIGGSNLTEDLVITAPTGYEVRENNTGTTFGSSVSFTPSSGAVATKTIEVRIAASALVGTPEGNVVCSSGATSQNVAVTGTVSSSSLLSQTIAFGSLAAVTYGDAPFTVSATGGDSGNPVIFTSSDENVATCTGTNGATVTILKAGSCSINANQAGNASYNAAPQIAQPLSINAKALTITDAAVTNKTYDATNAAVIIGTLAGIINSDDVTLSGTGTFSDANVADGIAVTSTSTLGGSKAGNYSLTQPTGLKGNITKAHQTITLAETATKTVGDADYSPATSATSVINTITYTSSNTAVATIISNQIHLVAAGTTIITASQAESANYNAATDVTQTLRVNAGPIVKWTFEGIATSNTGISPVLTTGSINADAGSQTSGSSFLAVHAIPLTSWTTATGNGSTKSLNSNTWSVGDYYQFASSLSGFQNIKLSYDQTGSNTGPKDFKLQYSTDGITYNDFGTSYSITNDSWTTTTHKSISTQNYDLSSVSTLNNASSVYFRIVCTSTAAISGTFSVAGAGRIDNFTINGDNITPIIINSITNSSSLPDCPTCDVSVASGGSFTIDAAKTYNSITVESGGKLNTTAPLTVGNLILKAVKDESSFSSIIDATITATSAKLFKTIDDTKWYYMAFPCDVTVADITKSNGESIGVLGTDWFIKYYDGEQRGNNGTAQTNWKHIEAIPTLTANRGYIFGLKTGTVELSIPLNSSVLAAESTDKNIAVAANKGAAANTNHGWNLIGHPYMSKYNAQSNASAPDYMIMPNPDGKTYTQTSKVAGTLPADLKPFAAYFVQVGAEGNIGFGRNGRQNVPASVAAEVSENIRLNLTTATGADYTYLIMDNDQTTEYQIGEDMVKWLGTGTDVPQVYTLIGDVSYAFNALPMASVVNLPIGLYTKNAGASTISVNALQAPSLSKLLLTDKKENITTDLLVSDYSFNATAGSDNTRFVMSAQRISTGDQINLIDAPSVISSNGKLIINELSPKTNIRIYDATGRLVMSKVAMERSIEIPLQVVGMYAVHIDAGIKNWTIKIVNNK